RLLPGTRHGTLDPQRTAQHPERSLVARQLLRGRTEGSFGDTQGARQIGMLDGDVVERPRAGPDPRGWIAQRPFQGEGRDVQPASSILEVLPCMRQSLQLAHETLGLADLA